MSKFTQLVGEIGSGPHDKEKARTERAMSSGHLALIERFLQATALQNQGRWKESVIQDTGQATRFAASAENGTSESTDSYCAEAMFAERYSELHGIAQGQLARYGAPISISPITLLHETYISLAERRLPSFPDRFRFFGYAARAMRGLVIDHARKRQAQKRGGSLGMTLVDAKASQTSSDARELVLIGDALDELAKIDPPLAEVVELRFFCGFSFVEIAGMRGVSQRTVQRDWDKARIFLHRYICPEPPL